MKILKMLRILALIVPFLALPLAGLAADTNSAAATPPKPDKLTTCPVSGEKLDGMGKPYVFIYEGQEVKLCCSGCKKDFDKAPAKYLKKIREADTPAQKGSGAVPYEMPGNRLSYSHDKKSVTVT